jgi:hypothetical protein
MGISELVSYHLNQFESVLRKQLNEFLVDMDDSDSEIWQELDEISQETRAHIFFMISHSFITTQYTYKYNKNVYSVLDYLETLLQYSIWASMNIPCPVDIGWHIQRVLDNSIQIYNETTYKNLRNEMINANYYIYIIQKCWRRAISNPEYAMCKKRLSIEFGNLQETTESDDKDTCKSDDKDTCKTDDKDTCKSDDKAISQSDDKESSKSDDKESSKSDDKESSKSN